MNEILTLVTPHFATDAYGDQTITETTRQVFCRVASIGQKEFYQATALGLQPEIKFILPDYLEYLDEPTVVYNDVRYNVLRTYRTGYELELVCSREVMA